ncbi:hypothetical protein AMK27_03815 [Streptomyces sp. CB02009]|uniref:hypothetical protein n=1 Tax=Streptomyces sp. CB02009 TaxID=1703938 RepID=UPI0009689E14|nr:hypothetical protein [Streptomyces sp. CB02009]OKJ64984.1 hypothetical protein AMK27_03815 [Streptomyces sp. CB02009]
MEHAFESRVLALCLPADLHVTGRSPAVQRAGRNRRLALVGSVPNRLRRLLDLTGTTPLFPVET